MVIKDVKKRIEELENIYDNMIKIQEYCLRNEDAKEYIQKIEEAAHLNNTLRNLASGTARYIRAEILRLQDIINNAVVKIN
ncbi:hypothetical protein D7V94_01850 [Parablautia intestinalis]|uniref:DUF2508 family protein n=1 Tax=Parablautia intestinalis TaxID=2320100 RepID=A0A3A9B3I4_9FIRM|nr:hypothetical protein [Parablautia intestinalis]RKI94311.1 hypothetical protein D7V94_01850 [Parablautia intestinalis]